MMEMQQEQLVSTLGTMVQDFIATQSTTMNARGYRNYVLRGNLHQQYYFTIDIEHDLKQEVVRFHLEICGGEVAVLMDEPILPPFEEITDQTMLEQFEATIYMYILLNSVAMDEVIWLEDSLNA